MDDCINEFSNNNLVYSKEEEISIFFIFINYMNEIKEEINIKENLINYPLKVNLNELENEKCCVKEKKRRIFKIEKIEKMKKKFIKRKINLDNVNIPKVKHLNVEKKKNRIQYQENHKKIIYSYCHLTPPYDFNKLFELIIQHQNANNKTFINKKSFHFIRKIDENIHIVTFREKQRFRKKGYC